MGLHVLLTQGLLPSTLAMARCLSGAGHRVTVGDHNRVVMARFSRHVARFVRLPAPTPDPQRFCKAVQDMATAIGVDVVIPVCDEGLILAACWTPQNHMAASMPAFSLALDLADKGTGVSWAGRLGLPVATTVPATAGATEISRALHFPLVIKPRFATGGTGVHVVQGRDALERTLASLETPADYVAQCWAGTRQLVFQGVFDHGRCVAAHAYCVLCRHPPEHGVGILLESVFDTTILAHGIHLGAHIGYHGALGIDFLADDAGVARVVEINPRVIFGVINAIDSGVPIPLRLAELGNARRDAVRVQPQSTPIYPGGVRSLHWPSYAVTAYTGHGFCRQVMGWAWRQIDDPGALAALLVTGALYHIRSGVPTAAPEDRTLSSALARQLEALYYAG